MAALATCAVPVRSNLGSRRVNYVQGEEGMPNPYVTEGLLAMWDGEWNVSVGVHSDTATVWKDISGNGNDCELTDGNYEWWDGAIFGLNRTSGIIGKLAVASLGTVGMVEIVCNPGYGRDMQDISNGIILSGGFGDGILIVRIMGYASRKVCQVLSGTHLSGWYQTPGYGTRQEDRTVSISTGISGSDTVSWFYNGLPIASPYNFVLGFAQSQYVCIGGYRTTDQRYPFVGPIYCIRVYSRQLTAEEVAWNFALDKERFEIP